MLELRSTLVASALTVAVGLSIASAPATAAGTATSAKSATATKAATKKKAAKKTTKKKAAAPKTVTACVNKKSGATKVLLGSKAKKKCAKGWTKMTWNVTGPAGKNGKNGANGANGATGATGPNGAPLAVRDSTGKRIGGFGGYFALGYPLTLLQVIADDGGLYTYLDSTGQLFPISGLSSGLSPMFADPGCAGPAFFSAGSAPSELSALLGGSLRFVYRSMTGPSLFNLGPTRAWKLTPSSSFVPAIVPPYYELAPNGACVALSGSDLPAAGDYLAHLESVVAPPDGVGPLTVG